MFSEYNLLLYFLHVINNNQNHQRNESSLASSNKACNGFLRRSSIWLASILLTAPIISLYSKLLRLIGPWTGVAGAPYLCATWFFLWTFLLTSPLIALNYISSFWPTDTNVVRAIAKAINANVATKIKVLLPLIFSNKILYN